MLYIIIVHLCTYILSGSSYKLYSLVSTSTLIFMMLSYRPATIPQIHRSPQLLALAFQAVVSSLRSWWVEMTVIVVGRWLLP